MTHKKIVIVLPLYNPRGNWEASLCKAIENLEQLFSAIDFEIVIVNDGSTIQIKETVDQIHIKYNNVRFLEYPENKGKGYAVKYGVENSEADYYIYSDYDFPFGYKAIFETYNILVQDNCDLVFGKRNQSYFSKLPIKRRIISKSLRTLNYAMLGFKAIDTQAGLKGLNARIKESLIYTKANGFIFEFEFIRKCLKSNCKIQPVNISIAEDITFSDFRFNIIFRELKQYVRLFFAHA